MKRSKLILKQVKIVTVIAMMLMAGNSYAQTVGEAVNAAIAYLSGTSSFCSFPPPASGTNLYSKYVVFSFSQRNSTTTVRGTTNSNNVVLKKKSYTNPTMTVKYLTGTGTWETVNNSTGAVTSPGLAFNMITNNSLILNTSTALDILTVTFNTAAGTGKFAFRNGTSTVRVIDGSSGTSTTRSYIITSGNNTVTLKLVCTPMG